MSDWATDRRVPYTAAGVLRVGCIRCGASAVHQWQVCADARRYRPLCLACDVALNELVLQWIGHPRAAELTAAYLERSAEA